MSSRKMGQCVGKVPPQKESPKANPKSSGHSTSPTKNGQSISPNKAKPNHNPVNPKDVHLREARTSSTAGTFQKKEDKYKKKI